MTKIGFKIYEWKCKSCKGRNFVLIDPQLAMDSRKYKRVFEYLEPYYYHYSETYPKNCHQRISYKEISTYARRVPINWTRPNLIQRKKRQKKKG